MKINNSLSDEGIDLSILLSNDYYHTAINNTHRYNFRIRESPAKAKYLILGGDIKDVITLDHHVVYPIYNKN